MTDLLVNGTLVPHASNLGAILANEIAEQAGNVPAIL